jgi:type VI secretion system protein ImpA
MKPIDVQALTAPISEDAPSGPDLEYDPASVALEEAARTQPEQQFGDTIVAAGEPDWAKVRDLAVGLLERSKDLRAALYLVQALTQGNGLPGLAQGLTLVRELLEAYWDSLHPQLDPDEDLDPTARVNILTSLCDPDLVLLAVRNAPIVRVPGLGGISLRDLQIARGQIPPPPEDKDVLKLDSIEAAMRSLDVTVPREMMASVQGAVEDTAAIEQLLVEKVGVTKAVSLDPLRATLDEIRAFLNEQLVARGEPSDASSGARTDEAGGGGDARGEGGAQRISGNITCPQDVIDALDKVISYYQAKEPSSPVPLLLMRAKRLVSLGFIDILRDLAPDALAQAANVTGVSADQDS